VQQRVLDRQIQRRHDAIEALAAAHDGDQDVESLAGTWIAATDGEHGQRLRATSAGTALDAPDLPPGERFGDSQRPARISSSATLLVAYEIVLRNPGRSE
jgi:hypothetical protein